MQKVMNVTYRLYRRKNGKYYAQHNETGRQISLRTSDENTAKLLLQGHNEGSRDAQVSREVGLAYLSCTDPEAKKRTWAWVFAEVLKTKSKDTDNYRRWSVAIRDKAFNSIRTMPLIDTRSDHFLKVLHEGSVSTNVFLRRIHNFAIDMAWLARPVIVKRQWPKVKHRKKRAVTWEEQKLIMSGEKNTERRDFYELLWHTGASQGDLAILRADMIDWRQSTIHFFRRKTGTPVCQRFAEEVAVILRRRPADGLLFPSQDRRPAANFKPNFVRRHHRGQRPGGVLIDCSRGRSSRPREPSRPACGIRRQCGRSQNIAWPWREF